MNGTPTEPAPTTPPAPGPADRPQQDPALVLDSQSLLQGRRAIHIQHLGRIYSLQATRQGKLILTR